MQEKQLEWLRLDNAAKLYPAIATHKWNCVYRVSAVLLKSVDADILQEAVEAAVERYPNLHVSIRKGAFWYYLQYSDEKPVVLKESEYPCQMMDLAGKNMLFRVLYTRNRVSVEFFHSVCDGYGAINFLNTVLLKYFNLMDKKVDSGNLLHYNDEPHIEEWEDSFLKYADPTIKVPDRNSTQAYKIKTPKEAPGILNVYQGEISVDSLKAVAKSYGATINEFIVACSAYICELFRTRDNNKKRRKKPVRVQFAVNLRRYFPSSTLRNFSGVGVIQLEDNARDMSFDKLVEDVSKKCKEECTEERMREFITSNCNTERNLIVKLMPLFIKTFVMRIALIRMGEGIQTVQVSNLGEINAPAEFRDYIDRYEFVLGAQKYNPYSISLASFNGKAVVTISDNVKTRAFEREFFRLLSSLGLDVKLNYNRGQGNER